MQCGGEGEMDQNPKSVNDQPSTGRRQTQMPDRFLLVVLLLSGIYYACGWTMDWLQEWLMAGVMLIISASYGIRLFWKRDDKYGLTPVLLGLVLGVMQIWQGYPKAAEIKKIRMMLPICESKIKSSAKLKEVHLTATYPHRFLYEGTGQAQDGITYKIVAIVNHFEGRDHLTWHVIDPKGDDLVGVETL